MTRARPNHNPCTRSPAQIFLLMLSCPWGRGRGGVGGSLSSFRATWVCPPRISLIARSALLHMILPAPPASRQQAVVVMADDVLHACCNECRPNALVRPILVDPLTLRSSPTFLPVAATDRIRCHVLLSRFEQALRDTGLGDVISRGIPVIGMHVRHGDSCMEAEKVRAHCCALPAVAEAQHLSWCQPTGAKAVCLGIGGDVKREGGQRGGKEGG
eukprot:3661455-Pleurochrysis_carterae.AAC.3